MSKALTTKAVEAAKPGVVRREVPDGAFPGLYLVVQPSGARSWAYRYRASGKPRKLTLGRFPVLSLADAREEARKAARGVELGDDPGAIKAEAKAGAREVRDAEQDKVRTLVDLYDRRKLAQLRRGADVRGFLNRTAVAAWGERNIADVTKRDVVDLLDRIVDAGTPIAANRTLAYLRAFFGWCVDRDVIAASPAAGVRPPAAERSRDRVLADDEIALLWRATARLGPPFGPLYRLLLLTGARLREVAEMPRDELVGDVWTIAPTRAKNGEAHVLPLAAAALAELEGLPRIAGSRHLFTTNGRSPVSGFAKAKTRLDAAMAKLAAEDGQDKAVVPFTIHDLRRTAASGMAELGITPHVIEAVLNHRGGTISEVARVYNRHSYEAEKRAALQAWGQHVLALTGKRAAVENLVSPETTM